MSADVLTHGTNVPTLKGSGKVKVIVIGGTAGPIRRAQTTL